MQVWHAKPHTLAKLTLLENYLTAYFQILGQTRSNQVILYVDGFAGPNVYQNHDRGSPTVAVLAAANAVRRAGNSWKAAGVHCVFGDRKQWIVEQCRATLAALDQQPGVQWEVRQGIFSDILPDLVDTYHAHFRDKAPLFVFADPFGAKGIPFDAIRSVLTSDTSELLLNFASKGLIRILKAQRRANAEENLDAIFGTERWRDVLDLRGDPTTLARHALGLYKDRLRSIPGIRYSFAFEMQEHAGSPDYHLVFASKHRLGLEKMKEAMKSITEAGDYAFCDANFQTNSLFRSDLAEDWAGVVFDAFSGQAVPAEVVWDFVLNDTLLVNAKRVLKLLEEQGFLEITRKHGCGKRRDLKAMESIKFKSGSYVPPVRPQPPLPEKGLFDGP